jgi:predicted porin
MKKSLVALAALAAAGVASAQSSVTLFGIVDASVSGTTTSYETPVGGGGPKASSVRLDNSGYNSSRLGFRGTEDLGGGLAASFWLEMGLSNDTGAAGSTAATTGLFNRRSTVSLSGGFGELRLGRDYKPTFWNNTVFDPFGTNGQGTNVLQNVVSIATGGTGLSFDSDNVRQSNTVGYFLPANLGGIYGQVQYGFDEKVKLTDPVAAATPAAYDSRSGDYIGGRIGYAAGPFDIAVAAGQGTIASNYIAGFDSTNTTYNIGASWDFGFMKLFGEYGYYELETKYDPAYLPSTKADVWGALLGVTVPVGPGLIRAAYSYAETGDPLAGWSDKASANKFALGYVHNLSKRTALYATVAYVDNKNGMPLAVNSPAGTYTGYVPNHSYGYDLGIRHSF